MKSHHANSSIRSFLCAILIKTTEQMNVEIIEIQLRGNFRGLQYEQVTVSQRSNACRIDKSIEYIVLGIN